jgi:hypothetical protein
VCDTAICGYGSAVIAVTSRNVFAPLVPPPDTFAIFVTDNGALYGTFTATEIVGYDAPAARVSLRRQTTGV